MLPDKATFKGRSHSMLTVSTTILVGPELTRWVFSRTPWSKSRGTTDTRDLQTIHTRARDVGTPFAHSLFTNQTN